MTGQQLPEETPSEEDADRIAVAGLILRLRGLGLTDFSIASAIESVPRRLFVPPGARSAYAERPLPMDCGQTMTGPEVVSRIVSELGVKPDLRVLEIGTGSGYQTAILARLARKVFTIDRFRTLIEAAERRFSTLRVTNIAALTADGGLGWPEEAPFDRIVVNASVLAIPRALLDQMVVGGVMLVPVGPPNGPQRLVRVDRDRAAWEETLLHEVRFVPLIPGRAARL